MGGFCVRTRSQLCMYRKCPRCSLIKASYFAFILSTTRTELATRLIPGLVKFHRFLILLSTAFVNTYLDPSISKFYRVLLSMHLQASQEGIMQNYQRKQPWKAISYKKKSYNLFTIEFLVKFSS